MRILVVDDDRRLCAVIKRGLLEEAYAVDLAYDGEEGEYLAEVNPYDLIILDIMLRLR
jgi:DNA-binding response OmpR family regulator